jgi:DNA-directed RNA polymerase specialized sigma24 family protein
LVSHARIALRSAPRAAADEEDVALSAFDSFCRGLEQGRFPNLSDREDLWRLLVVITARKACRQIQRELAAKRGGGNVRNEADLPDAVSDEGLLAQVVGTEPTPAFAAQVAEECRRLLALLQGADLRSIALWRMEGYTVEEIASRLGRSPRTVALRLKVIRRRWQEEQPS